MSSRVDPSTLPWSPEAEQAILGAVLLSPDVVLDLADRRLQASHFFDLRHRAIWAAIEALTAARMPVDVVMLHERLSSAGNEELCGGMEYLSALLQGAPGTANVCRYADIVLEKAIRRAIVDAANRAQDIASEPGTAAEVLDRVQTLFGTIQMTRAGGGPRSLGELLPSRIEHWQALEAGDATPGISTGLDRLDEALGGGIKRSKVIVLAARPSVGKSSFAQQVGLQVASQGHSVLMLSQEMPAADLVDRAVANLARVPLDRLVNGHFRDDDWARIADGADTASRLPFYIDDQAGLTLNEVRAKARRMQQQHGLTLLIVDYLQLCASTAAGDTRHHQIEVISRGLKTLSRELECCVMLLSQLNRSAAEGEPEAHHLKESGSIEEDADVVMLMHPLGRDEAGGTQVLLKLPKNRQGRRGRFGLLMQGPLQHWSCGSFDVSSKRGGMS